MSEPVSPDGTIVIVGASLAGLRAAEEIRHEGHTGPVVIIGEEIHAPYDRPPLSKQVLSGKWDVDRIHHHSPDAHDTLALDFRLGRRATGVDTDTRTVSCSDGTEVVYDGLVIATGAAARSLPGTEGMPGVWMLRTLDDCLGIRAGIAAAGDDPRVVVVGAGFIGSEVAATCQGLGADRPVPISTWLTAWICGRVSPSITSSRIVGAPTRSPSASTTGPAFRLTSWWSGSECRRP
jgi:3-phenylpropionate/trans-cinnamate dioxygenase ferredoxin reductase subunit